MTDFKHCHRDRRFLPAAKRIRGANRLSCFFSIEKVQFQPKNSYYKTMKKLLIDCSCGMSGDMTLGAMLSLGVPLRVLEEGLDSLGLNEFDLTVNKTEYCVSPNASGEGTVPVTDVDVILHNREHAWIHPYSGKYRNYAEIREIIDSSSLPGRVKALSKRIFDIKAEAESIAHRVPVDEVQFHEVGAVDSIVDIVGTAICVDYAGADEVIAKPVPTGFGTIMCACGELPVPAPAVQAILRNTGLPHYRSDVEQELLTPTGAAILSGIVDRFVSEEEFEALREDAKAGQYRIGYGTGKRETGLPPLAVLLKY